MRYSTLTVTAMKARRKPATERRPIYNNDRDRRIISAPSGQWLPQWKRAGAAGSRDFDPWNTIHAPTTKHRAALSAFGPGGLASKGLVQ